jgi:hypothetical protein
MSKLSALRVDRILQSGIAGRHGISDSLSRTEAGAHFLNMFPARDETSAPGFQWDSLG